MVNKRPAAIKVPSSLAPQKWRTMTGPQHTTMLLLNASQLHTHATTEEWIAWIPLATSTRLNGLLQEYMSDVHVLVVPCNTVDVRGKSNGGPLSMKPLYAEWLHTT